jgi:hypothetical protein
MAQEIKVSDRSCLIPTFERNRYFTGKPMMVSDFDAEQRYLIGKNRVQNQLIHGAGIICGLTLSNAKIADGKLSLEISEGAALDCCGNLIVVNRTDRVEVQRQGTIDGTYYLYIRFSECVREPIMTPNVSSCEEACCYNRIRETFELVVIPQSTVTTTEFRGVVKTGAARDRVVLSARITALQNGTLRATTLTDNSGNFSLLVPGAGAFDIDASATGFASIRRASVSITAGEKKPIDDFVLVPHAGLAASEVCTAMTQDYFEENSRNCRQCGDPKVFLAVATIAGANVTLDSSSGEVRRKRAVVYTNTMLHDSVCDHVSDFNNPHRTTAAQVKALQNVNGVGNSDSKPEVVSRIDLVSDETLTITNDVTNNRITITGPAAATQQPKPVSSVPNIGSVNNRFAREDHVHNLEDKVVERKHLSDDTFDKLVFSSDSSIKVATKQGTSFGDRQIDITTKVPSAGNQLPQHVALDPFIGTSANYAREDHMHNLGVRVVGNQNLDDEVVNTFILTDQTISVSRDLNARQVTLKTNPATEVSSVGREKRVGTLLKFARQDHVHNLQINDRGPDDNGNFRLTAGENIQIAGGADNELIVSARDGGSSFTVSTGLLRFEKVRPRELRTSPRIRHQLTAASYAIVLGLDTQEVITIGQFAAIDPLKPQLEAIYKLGSDFFQINLRDSRAEGETASYAVRWWAIPFTLETETVVSLPFQPLIPVPDLPFPLTPVSRQREFGEIVQRSIGVE